MSRKPWGIHWFRRDLRVPGNFALEANRRTTDGRTLGLFCFDSRFLSRDDFSHNRFAMFLATIEELRKDLKKLGGDLLVVDCLPQDAFPRLLAHAKAHDLGAPALVTFGRDYEPFARARDTEVEKLLTGAGVKVETARDHLLFEPHEVLKNDGAFYRVYSPYARKWFEALEGKEGKARLKIAFAEPAGRFALKWSALAPPFEDRLAEFRKINDEHVEVEIPEAGHVAALALLDDFKKQIETYADRRDFPAAYATSRISWYLKNGSITIAQIFAHLKLDGKRSPGRQKYAQELVWREFFYNVLQHRPDVEGHPFEKKYEKLKWQGDDKLFRLWCEGKTGVPIVDAGMRELAKSGWIMNRMRIITASFLVKDLLVDWRKGELHFMHLLLDGDLANNNGNWQWVASTGAEAQPFFRVLNPWTQGKRFDPDGTYIREHVPELRDAPTALLHDPEGDRSRYGYTKPVVDHAVQRDRAIQMYKKK